jgi:hypothetical protein
MQHRKLIALVATSVIFAALPQTFGADKKAAKKPKDVNEVRTGTWSEMDYGPFLSASIVAKQPHDNVTIKGIVVSLGASREGADSASIVFDTQLMRIGAAWTGGYLNFDNVAFSGGHGSCNRALGEQRFGTHQGLGWGIEGNFKDPRPEPFGGMPRDVMRYNGLFRAGNQIVFSYSIADAQILELPGIERANDEVAFTRTLQVGPSSKSLTINIADNDDAKGSTGEHGTAKLEGRENDTAAGLLNAPADAKWQIANDGKVSSLQLVLPPHKEIEKFTVVIWGGPKDHAAHFADFLKPAPTADLIALTKGGPAHWPQTIETTGKLGGADAKDASKAYVVDTIATPDRNPWHSWLRFGGFDFFPDGHSAALCTWSGDVWIAKGIDDKLDHVTWKRYAAGLFQTLGLKIIDGDVYVMGRDQITHLHDLNGDGEADFYENFNNDVAATDHFHEFQFDLQQDKAGNLYFIKGGGVNPGGRGFQLPISANHGTLMKVDKYGSKLEVIATGFRAPNGMCVDENGQAVTGDNQGSWTPVDRLNWIKPGMFCGVPDLAHLNPIPTATDNPLCWIIYPSWDNSCGDPVFCTSDKFGPFNNELLYLSYGQCSLYEVLKEKAPNGEMQGGLVRFPLDFASGSMRARFNPVDGQLYVCGFKGWQTRAKTETSFQRVRYTGKNVYLPTAMHVKDTGIEISFQHPLDKKLAEDAGSWNVEQWTYRWTSDYGSPEVKISDPKQRGHDPVDVKSAKLSEDGKTVFLEIPKLQPVMQMLIQGDLQAADGTPMKVEIANTINAVNGQKLLINNEHPSGTAVPIIGNASAR